MGGARTRSKAPALVYDEAAHREFVTGFRRRKQARRQEAAASAASAEKQARRDARQEKREVLRATAEKAREYSDDDADAALADGDVSEGDGGREEVTYQGEEAVITTVVAPIESAFDRHLPRTGGGEQARKPDGVSDCKGAPPKVGKVRKVLPTGARKRKVSYTHALSKGNKRKAKMKSRKAAAANK